MHSVVISKIEYRIIGEENFSSLDFTPETAILNEDQDETANGTLQKTSVQFSIANVTVAASSSLKNIRNRKLQFRLTDTNGLVHLVGDDYYCARIRIQKAIERTPGSFNGYRCSVRCNSPSGSSVS